MSRPYKDAVELATRPVGSRRSPLTPEDAVVVEGAYFPGVPDAAPLVLSPEYEYRLVRVPAPLKERSEKSSDQVWVVERRRASKR